MRVDHVILGAGLAALALRRHLRSERVVLIDPQPAGYKIGESFVPEQFRYPEMAALLPRIQQLPSHARKIGTTFISHDSVASFPLPPEESQMSMHVARSELEALLLDAWKIDVVRDRVVEIDVPGRRVTTAGGRHFESEGPLLDCSGPAALIARTLGTHEQKWPVSATWAYFDVTEIREAAFWAWVRDSARAYRRYDAGSCRIIPGDENDDWSPSRTTMIMQLRPGVWMWQIPLYEGRLLSVGVVARGEPFESDAFFDTVEASLTPNYVVARRSAGDSPFDRLHHRVGFAQTATRAAAEDFILLADAFTFSDPVYSVGTAVAVSHGVEVASLLNDGPWTADKAAAFDTRCKAQARTNDRAFQAWYDGQVLRDDTVASQVQERLLIGTAFQTNIAAHYGNMLVQVRPTPEIFGTHCAHFAADLAAADQVTEVVADLVGDTGADLGWIYLAAVPGQSVLQCHFGHRDKPELIAEVRPAPRDAPVRGWRAGDLELSCLSLWDRRYPADDEVVALFKGLRKVISRDPAPWRALVGFRERRRGRQTRSRGEESAIRSDVQSVK